MKPQRSQVSHCTHALAINSDLVLVKYFLLLPLAFESLNVVWLRISEYPGVVSVFPNRGRRLHTTRSWQFLGLERGGEVPSWSAWEVARYGEDTIIGNLDSGTSVHVLHANVSWFQRSCIFLVSYDFFVHLSWDFNMAWSFACAFDMKACGRSR